ncbi:MAG: nicotinate (nicotinamide) nucleotide adenylyltransferase [Kangiellaceae bacterium]|nr:nicotinate (nicotinamide) nucleotide adenylyltransferase [Kangiellaceae bacterium]
MLNTKQRVKDEVTKESSMERTRVEVILGGSFDPIHNGHINIVESIRKYSSDWHIRIMPCAIPSLKKVASASFEQRVAMIELVFSDNNNVSIDLREGQRTGKSYTVDSLIEINQEQPESIIVFVIGSDNLEGLEQWHQSERLASLCHLMIIGRPNYGVEQSIASVSNIGFIPAEKLSSLELDDSGLFFELSVEEKDISSTEIRQAITHGSATVNETPVVVQKYIERNFIYQ